ncbi:DUF4281 domain-containing protein [Opitutia bacterium ISCC 51]|nr:DUF4281 domain-containing protein [Opitutae bacterium ISCC 51]QXD27058.1 DUF4281 domain-containing protein [Opitutae bacterium ISCC 52]
MPVWIVEMFGEARLNLLFWIITGSTAPFWILMLFFGRHGWAKALCHPWLIPPLLGCLHIYTVYLLFTITSAPEVPDPSMKGVREFWSQPFLFLSLWAHRMILDLFCGMMLNRTKEGEGTAGKFSLVLVWLLGPIGLMIFAVRYWANYRERR